jgi:hypothetical protein
LRQTSGRLPGVGSTLTSARGCLAHGDGDAQRALEERGVVRLAPRRDNRRSCRVHRRSRYAENGISVAGPDSAAGTGAPTVRGCRVLWRD